MQPSTCNIVKLQTTNFIKTEKEILDLIIEKGLGFGINNVLAALPEPRPPMLMCQDHRSMR
jgi:hypothetical protein